VLLTQRPPKADDYLDYRVIFIFFQSCLLLHFTLSDTIPPRLIKFFTLFG
jgi:hypothetical protein